MPTFLKEIVTFVLEQLSSLGKDALSDKVSDYALQKADESARDYLLNHASEYEYDKLDAFLQKEGIYSADQSMENSATLNALRDQIISDFCAAHPQYIGDLTVLKNVIDRVYKATIGQLSLEGRILYNQNIKHSAKEQQEHAEIKQSLAEIREILTKDRKTNLPKEEVKSIYNLIISAIADGSFALADSVVALLDNQVSENERFYCTACYVQLDYYLRGTEAVLCSCKKFVQETPVAEVAFDVASFLVQVNEVQGLSIVYALVENPLFEEFAKKLVMCEPNEIFTFLVQENHEIKTEYQTCDYAWWAIGNAALKFGSKLTAYQMYSVIEQKQPSFWVRWQKCRASAKLAVTNFIVTQKETTKSKLYHATEKLLEFSQTFSLMHNEILTEFVDEVLLCAGMISLENFDLFWNQLSPRMRNLPCAREHWYHVRVATNWHEVNERELRNFCCSEGKEGLWSVYLYQRAQEDASFVINEFSENSDSLQRDFIAVSAYAWALALSRGADVALETIESMALSTEFAFPKLMLLTEISFFANSEKKNQRLDQALSAVKSVGGFVSVMDVHRLTDFLVRGNRWQEAELLLKQYQEAEPSLGVLRLKILMPHEERSDTCRELITKLERNYIEDGYLLYCKGILEERSLAGSGYESFEKAFHASPSPDYAYAVLAARLNRRILRDDDILAYASHQEDVRSKYISGLTYLKMENIPQADIIFLQALLLCNDEYDDDLFGAYVGEQIEKSEHLATPEEIKSDTCIILTKKGDGTIRKIWIHGDAIAIPEKGSTFAGYTHIQSNTPEALLLLGHKQSDRVDVFGDEYVVTAINYGDTIATKYCMEQLLAHGKIQAISVSENRIDEFLTKLKEITKPHSEHVQKMLELYQNHNPGITLHLLANSIGGLYFEVLRSLCLDPNIQFWAGCDGDILKGNCILTLSTISTLATLNIHPPKVFPPNVEFFITPIAKAEVEAQIRAHRHSRSSGVMGFDKDDKPYLIDNTTENKRLINTYYACLLEWCNYAKLSRDALPEEYPEKLKEVAVGIGAPDMEVIVLAQKDGYSVFSDDLLIRKYLSALNISNATAIGIMILMDIQVESMLGHIEALISANYQSPITPEFIRWLSQKFSSISGEEEQEAVSIQTISVIKKQIEIPLGFEALLYAMRSLKMEKYEIHETLFWIISTIISKYLLDHPQLLSMEG